MNDRLQALMQEATRLTRAGRLDEATAVLQRAMGAAPAHGAMAAGAVDLVDVLDVEEVVDIVEVPRRMAPAEFAPQLPPRSAASRSATTEPGRFTRATHRHAGLTRDYRLYVPPGARAGALPLVVMLHGCKQDPDDFAAGTAMNRRAAEQGFIVLYPAQATSANAGGCWNWFKPDHQQRDRGEPALIASLTQAVTKAHDADPRRVYVAGLSAGGAMAAVLGQAYPELFAAVGVHSGLPVGAARDVMSALTVMKSGAASGQALARASTPAASAPSSAPFSAPSTPLATVPTIVFHGDRDTTVHPRNGDQLVAALLRAGAGTAPAIEPGVSAQGRRFTRTVHRDAQGLARVEHWLLHGAGHAWSGGDPSGSYADPDGPDATREMLRFFFQHLNLGG
jgi:poly(hydroxyalkanoate) depolymerase family esterase